MANTGRPSDYIKRLEANRIITRDMKIYTYLELHSSIDLIEKSFFNDCELREEYQRSFTNENYLKDIEYTLELQKDFLIKSDDEFFNYLKKIIIKEIIKDEEQLKYLSFLLYSYCNGIFNTSIEKEDIYTNNFSIFEMIKNRIKDYLQNSNPKQLKTFNTMQLMSNKNANILKKNMLIGKIYNDDIDKIFSHYVDYSLIHNESSKLNKDSYYVQIDLSSQDEEILRVIKLMKKELNIKTSKRNKTIRDGLSLGEKRANMLFVYDCITLGLSRTYIKEQIEYYCDNERRNFILSDNKLDDYIKELKIHI